MKGGLAVDDPNGARWQLALDLLESGEEFVMLHEIQLQRHVAWPGADGRIHIAVLTTAAEPDRDLAQGAVDAAREQILAIATADARLRSLLDAHGVAWEYAGDDGHGSWLIATADADGQLVWTNE